MTKEIAQGITFSTHFHEKGKFDSKDIDPCLSMSINGANTKSKLEQLRESIDSLGLDQITIAVDGLVHGEAVVLSIFGNNNRDFNICPLEALLNQINSKPETDTVQVSVYPFYANKPRI